MARRVLVGGLGSCNRQVELVASELSEYYDEEIGGLSFREANADSRRLHTMTRDAIVLTHSAGMMAIRGTYPREILAIAPPLPVRRPYELVRRAATSGRDLLEAPYETDDELRKILECGRNTAVELGRHPFANLGEVALIATFNAIRSGIEAQEAGISVGLGFMDKDRLFQMNEEQRLLAERKRLLVVSLSGGHEKFAYLPGEVMDEYEMRRMQADDGRIAAS